jgi:hypothetical protein
MAKLIKFTAQDPYFFEVCPKPIPASQAVPQWWKDAPPYMITENNPTGTKLNLNGMSRQASFKKCTPMLDSITSGYVFPLWADVLVTQTDQGPSLTWRVSKSVFSLHTKGGKMPTFPGYHEQPFKYNNAWIPKLPKGYSAYITPVAGNPDAIFHPITGIIDYDKSIHQLSVPGYIKEGFEGIIEKGTPMFQLTPFKRENWVSEFDHYTDFHTYSAIEDREVLATIINNYIKNVWHKKSYK